MLLLEQIVFYPAYLALSCVCWLAIALTCTAGSVLECLVCLAGNTLKFMIYTSCFDLVFDAIEYVITDIVWTAFKNFLYAMIMRRIYDAIYIALHGVALLEPSHPNIKKQARRLERLARTRQNAN
jgi:hypothetical protein